MHGVSRSHDDFGCKACGLAYKVLIFAKGGPQKRRKDLGCNSLGEAIMSRWLNVALSIRKH
jgi:hypothetical protein